jgi:mRNA interferase MazF
MKRGDVVLAAASGDFGKPRPWVVVQADMMLEDSPSITLCPITTFAGTEQDFRVRLDPSAGNSLRDVSSIMADKIQTLQRHRVRGRLGAVGPETLRAVDTALRVWLGLA